MELGHKQCNTKKNTSLIFIHVAHSSLHFSSVQIFRVNFEWETVMEPKQAGGMIRSSDGWLYGKKYRVTDLH